MLRVLGLGLRILGSGFVGFRVRRLGLWLLHIIIESHGGLEFRAYQVCGQLGEVLLRVRMD